MQGVRERRTWQGSRHNVPLCTATVLMLCCCRYDLMTRLQLGIRHSVGVLNQEQQRLATLSRPGGGAGPHVPFSAAEALSHQQGPRKLLARDFSAKNKTFFPSSGRYGPRGSSRCCMIDGGLQFTRVTAGSSDIPSSCC